MAFLLEQLPKNIDKVNKRLTATLIEKKEQSKEVEDAKAAKQAIQEKVNTEKERRAHIKTKIEELRQENEEAQRNIDKLSKDIEYVLPKTLEMEDECGNKQLELKKE